MAPMSAGFTESVVEEAALEWLAALGWDVRHGPVLEPGEPWGEDVVLRGRLREALARLNPGLPREALDDALRKLLAVEAPTLVERNRAVHRLLVDGVNVEFRHADGSIRGAQARVLDFDDPRGNDWLAVNQVAVVEGRHARRPDVVLFVNGLPLAVIELKNAADEDATVWTAHGQLQTYQAELPALFAPNVVLVASDGVQARIGALGAGREWFKPWRTIEGDGDASVLLSELEVLLKGVFDRRRFLDLVRHFVVFEDEGTRIVKKLAGYHQFHAVNVALAETLRAAEGDRRVGVVWHTQGSGKSLTMAFYAGRVILEPAMANPTVVVLTDRNDLDDQLFGVFARCRDLLRQPPVQAADRADLRERLAVGSGGVVFTTIQKFLPEEKGDRHSVLSDRRNVVVIADEAHRSQYDFVDGFARHMRDALPHASFIGFTGTPIERADASTRAVFGDTISVYDIQRAVRDGATVPIYYESRLAKLGLDETARPTLDADFEEVTEGEEVERAERLKSRWGRLEALVGAEARIELVARDLVEHFERRLEAMEGKAMVVCMSRRICVDLFRAIEALRPSWVGDDDAGGSMKVVMTGSASDPVEWQRHIRSKSRREELANRFRDPDDPFRVVIVRDMWLTGFDAPSLHTMYVDKPMRGHGLMQAIARVNRVFRDKPGGLVVDYLGLADELKQALATYTESGGEGRATLDQAEAIALMLEKHEVCVGIFHGFGRAAWVTGTAAERLSLLPAAQEHVLAQADGKERLLQAVTELSKAFALAVPSDEALAIRDDVAFFQAVRAALLKRAAGERRTDEDLDHAIRQLVSQAIVSDEVCSRRPGSRSRTSRSSPTSSSPRCVGCRSGTSRSSCFASCSPVRSGRARGGTSSRRGCSRRCSRRLCAGTRIARSRPRR
jgi:type I restriction enzyme R subunit